MKKDLLRFFLTLLATVALAGCGSTPATPAATGNDRANTPTSDSIEAPTSTPDVCSTEMIEAEVQKVHNHMREFDDASILASNLPREELNDSIANLQRIRREAEDEQIPACLTKLKDYQVDHMNTVIDTLVAFLGGTDTESLERGIAIAREQHDQYALELARLLGLTVVPATESRVSTPAVTATP